MDYVNKIKNISNDKLLRLISKLIKDSIKLLFIKILPWANQFQKVKDPKQANDAKNPSGPWAGISLKIWHWKKTVHVS